MIKKKRVLGVAHTRVHTHTHRARTHARTHARTRTHTHTLVCMWCVCVGLCISLCVCVCVCECGRVNYFAESWKNSLNSRNGLLIYCMPKACITIALITDFWLQLTRCTGECLFYVSARSHNNTRFCKKYRSVRFNRSKSAAEIALFT
jgi:hypothetical protein